MVFKTSEDVDFIVVVNLESNRKTAATQVGILEIYYELLKLNFLNNTLHIWERGSFMIFSRLRLGRMLSF